MSRFLCAPLVVRAAPQEAPVMVKLPAGALLAVAKEQVRLLLSPQQPRGHDAHTGEEPSDLMYLSWAYRQDQRRFSEHIAQAHSCLD